MTHQTQNTQAIIELAQQQSVALAEFVANLQNSQMPSNALAIPAELSLSADQLAVILTYLEQDLSLEDLAIFCGSRDND